MAEDAASTREMDIHTIPESALEQSDAAEPKRGGGLLGRMFGGLRKGENVNSGKGKEGLEVGDSEGMLHLMEDALAQQAAFAPSSDELANTREETRLKSLITGLSQRWFDSAARKTLFPDKDSFTFGPGYPTIMAKDFDENNPNTQTLGDLRNWVEERTRKDTNIAA